MGVPTHRCGACGRRLFTARMVRTGTMVHVERDPLGAGDLQVVPDLPGVVDDRHLPHVARSETRRWPYREHTCPAVRSFTGTAPARKVRL